MSYLAWWQRIVLYVWLFLGYKPRPRVYEHEGAVDGWSPREEYGEGEGEWAPLKQAEREFSDHMNRILWDIVGGDPLLMVEVLRWGDSTMSDTGTFDRAELEALLDAENPIVMG